MLIFDDEDELNNVPEAWPWVRPRTWCGAIVRFGSKFQPKVGKVVVLHLDGTLDLESPGRGNAKIIVKGVRASDLHVADVDGL